MSIQRYAILKAAEHIEARPADFLFTWGDIPLRCGSPGCALGWIGHFAGFGRFDSYMDVAVEFLGLEGWLVADSVFYERVSKLMHGQKWFHSAPLCAQGLRLFADKYFPRPTVPNGYGMP